MQILDQLFNAAKGVQPHAHAPYSKFKVGAAALAPDGSIHIGCNVENAAYPVGTCAEQAAIAALIGAGHKRLAAILVIGDGDLLVTPCGGCRQRIREFAAPDTPIHIAGPSGWRVTYTLQEILPESFGPDNLAQTVGRPDRIP